MFFVFSGPTGEDFDISNEQKIKLKKEILKLLADKYEGEICSFNIKADDCLGIVATEACLEFIEANNIKDYKIRFICTYAGDFSLMTKETQAFYNTTIDSLKMENNRCVVDVTNGLITVTDSRKDMIQRYDNYHCIMYSQNADFYITYYNQQKCGDKVFLKDVNKWYFSSKKCINLYPVVSKSYTACNTTGVRKRKNSSKYYYRIKCKLPDGTPINIEKGSFLTEALAAKARREHLIALTTQNCEDSNRTVDDVFQEFIDATCHNKPSLKKKYISCYNSRFKTALGKLHIGETEKTLNILFDGLYNHKLPDNRSNGEKILFSSSYVQGLKAMLFNFYDYAYNMKYICSHPMYALTSERYVNPKKATCLKEKNKSIEPLFAYLGNKHKLLPDIQKLFPKDFHFFVDLFGGSSVVGINTDAKQIIINDSSLFLIGIYKGIQATTPEAAWNLIEAIINKYSLDERNESGYYTCRNEYNNIPYEKRCTEFWYWGLVLVWCSFNRSTVQFNQQKEYNAPFGFNKVNFNLAKRKFFAFSRKVFGSKIIFTCEDYKIVKIPENSFVYVDPPYLITTATYNKGWDEQAERELYSYLENLNNNGVKWAMSNVFENNGNKHPTLPEWVRENGYKVHYLESEYIHANFRRKNKGKTVEVLVTNY